MRKALVIVVLALGLQLSASASAASTACTRPHAHPIGSGPIPGGGTWSVTAMIKNNVKVKGGCESWLFGLDYELGEFGNAGTGTGIPPGGHVSREYFTLDASIGSNLAGTEVIYGYTRVEGAKLVATRGDGQKFTVRPRLVPEPLRAKVAWLRPFRFFVYFYPSGSPIESLSLYTRGGRLIYRTKGYEGSFF